MIMHGSPQGLFMLCWHKAEHSIMANGSVFGLTLGMNLQCTRKTLKVCS